MKEVAQLQTTAGPSPFPSPIGRGVKCEVTPISWAQAIRLIGPICPLLGLFSELNTTWGSMLIPHEYVKSFRHTRIQYMPFMLQEHALQRSRTCPS